MNRDSLDWVGVCCEAVSMIDDDSGLDDNGHCGMRRMAEQANNGAVVGKEGRRNSLPR
jgi:hypothetical protein